MLRRIFDKNCGRGSSKQNRVYFWVRWLIGIGIVLLIFITYGIWSRQNYLSQLRETESLLSHDLHLLIDKNHHLQNQITDRQKIVGSRKLRWGIEGAVSQLRGLLFHHPIRYQHIKKSGMKSYLLSKLRSQYSLEEFQNYELALKRIGLLPQNVHLLNTVTELLSEQIAAFYDPDSHELYTFNELDLKNNFERMILAHELIHALQDQNFDFASPKFRERLRAKDNDDAAIALAALVEGDASYYMSLYVRENFQAAQFLGDLRLLFAQRIDKLATAPIYLRDSLIFPYQTGLSFVSEIHALGGNTAINAAFADPPQSTEQVIHPEKYLGAVKDLPKPVSCVFKINPSWKKLHENVVGEFGINALFSELLGIEKSSQIAMGWGGDRYVMYETSPGKWMLVWKIVWDTEKDAREFFEALDYFYRSRYEIAEMSFPKSKLGKNPKTSTSANAVFFSWANQKQNITLNGKTVLFLDMPNTQLMNQVLSELMQK